MKRAKDYLTTQVTVPMWFLWVVFISATYTVVHDGPLWFAVAYVAACALIMVIHRPRRDSKRTV